MLENEIQVGKYTLESLTTGMYSDPKIVYREYIQNSVDSLEAAVSMHIIEKQSMRIDIIVSEEEGYISIKDNGTGISKDQAVQTLTNIGSSTKRHSNNRGFRGIGRLGGMSYCDTLKFSTSAENESVKTTVIFNCKKLREMLIPGAYEELDMAAVIHAVTEIITEEERPEKHYFIVEMIGVNSFSDLLDLKVVKSYISQVAPLAYKSRNFIYSEDLHRNLENSGYLVEEFPIFVGENEQDLEPIYKPNRSRFHSDRRKMVQDDMLKLQYFEVIIDDELYALGWYADCNWHGTISEKEIAGIRVRKGNILIGDNKVLDPIFTETRFNNWVQGELFIVTNKLIPNARRDDFEQNREYFKLIEYLSQTIGKDIPRKIREASNARNDISAVVINEAKSKLAGADIMMREGFNSSTDKNRLLADLSTAQTTLQKTKIKPSLQPQREELGRAIEEKISEVEESSNYKINQINSGIDKKSKKILIAVSDILSKKLAKELVDEIIEEVINELNRK